RRDRRGVRLELHEDRPLPEGRPRRVAPARGRLTATPIRRPPHQPAAAPEPASRPANSTDPAQERSTLPTTIVSPPHPTPPVPIQATGTQTPAELPRAVYAPDRRGVPPVAIYPNRTSVRPSRARHDALLPLVRRSCSPPSNPPCALAWLTN